MHKGIYLPGVSRYEQTKGLVTICHFVQKMGMQELRSKLSSTYWQIKNNFQLKLECLWPAETQQKGETFFNCWGKKTQQIHKSPNPYNYLLS